MSSPKLHIGCSGYTTPQWKGIFYPEDLPTRKWFEYYCTQFGTYEINGSFYKFPTAKSLQTWYNKAPEGFIFSLKAPKIITHLKRFIDCEEELDAFYTACCEGLADKLGCVLFQLPPSYDFTEDRLNILINSMNPEFKNVIEFRNQSWWQQEVYSALQYNNISFCSVDYPKLPNAVIATNTVGYYRFHGNPQLFYSQYSREEAQAVYDAIMKQDTLKEAHVFFNNTASEAAIINAVEMKAMHS
jgi:uncharacterized protein YecE (DUF72 family)